MAGGRPIFIMVVVALLAAQGAAAVKVAASKTAPGGPTKVQLVVFTHDDDVSSTSSKVVLGLSDSFKNPNGCKLPVTWFACTKGCSFSCSEAKKLYKKGHEIAVHTVHHYDLRTLSKDQIQEEIVGARDTIVGCGIPAQAVNGFRCPYLSDKPEVRQVLYSEGFRYDSTVGQQGGKNRIWPATCDKGVPYDCNQGGQQCSKSERYPGFWEAPLYAVGGNSMDYCTDENTGAPRAGCSAYAALKKEFDDAYSTNRAPVQILIHTPYLQHKQYWNDVKKFLKYAMSHPNTWAVTMQQLLDWMEAGGPGPAQMPAFMSRYTCPQ